MNSLGRPLVVALVLGLVAAFGPVASAQVFVYPTYRPIVAAPVVAAPVIAAPVVAAPVVAAPTYVANYVPAGNYAAVTAFSPPVVTEPAAIAVRAAYPPAYTPAYAPLPAAPVAVTAYSAPPVMAVPAAPVVAAPVPVTTYYAPTAVAVPMRRGILGGWRPVRAGYVIPY